MNKKKQTKNMLMDMTIEEQLLKIQEIARKRFGSRHRTGVRAVLRGEIRAGMFSFDTKREEKCGGACKA